MTKTQARIEILKLIHRHDQTPETILARGKEFEKWVLEEEKPKSSESDGPKRSVGKKNGNVDPLS